MNPETTNHELLQVTLVKEHTTRIRDLKGFRKTHQLPTEFSEHTQTFITRIAADDINDDLEQRFSEIRGSLKYRRADLSVADASAGTGSIATPGFEYRVTARLSSSQLTHTHWRREVRSFRNPQHLNWTAFSAAFGSLFDTVEFRPEQMLDLVRFIDWIEDQANNNIRLEYDRNTTWCRLFVEGIPGHITVIPEKISLTTDRPCLPAELLKAFFSFRTQLHTLETL